MDKITLRPDLAHINRVQEKLIEKLYQNSYLSNLTLLATGVSIGYTLGYLPAKDEALGVISVTLFGFGSAYFALRGVNLKTQLKDVNVTACETTEIDLENRVITQNNELDNVPVRGKSAPVNQARTKYDVLLGANVSDKGYNNELTIKVASVTQRGSDAAVLEETVIARNVKDPIEYANLIRRNSTSIDELKEALRT